MQFVVLDPALNHMCFEVATANGFSVKITDHLSIKKETVCGFGHCAECELHAYSCYFVVVCGLNSSKSFTYF